MEQAATLLEHKRAFEQGRDTAIKELLAEREKIDAMLTELGYEAPKRRRAKRAPKAEKAANKTAERGE